MSASQSDINAAATELFAHSPYGAVECMNAVEAAAADGETTIAGLKSAARQKLQEG